MRHRGSYLRLPDCAGAARQRRRCLPGGGCGVLPQRRSGACQRRCHTAAEHVLELIGNVPALAGDLTELRRIAALELRRRGFKVARIAELAGVTSSAISQLLGPDCLADPIEPTP